MRTPFYAQFPQRYLKPTVFAAAMMSSLAFTACGDSSVTAVATVSEVVGVRPMNSAYRKSLPATFTDGSGKQLTIKSGSLTIAADGQFVLHYVGDLVVDGGFARQTGLGVNGRCQRDLRINCHRTPESPPLTVLLPLAFNHTL